MLKAKRKLNSLHDWKSGWQVGFKRGRVNYLAAKFLSVRFTADGTQGKLCPKSNCILRLRGEGLYGEILLESDCVNIIILNVIDRQTILDTHPVYIYSRQF